MQLATNCVQNTPDTDKVSARSGLSNPTEGAKDNPNNSTPKTPQTGDSTYGSVAQMPSGSSDITTPPTDSYTPPGDSQQPVAGPVFPRQHTQEDVTAVGGQFTGGQPEMKKACENIIDKHNPSFVAGNGCENGMLEYGDNLDCNETKFLLDQYNCTNQHCEQVTSLTTLECLQQGGPWHLRNPSRTLNRE